MADENWFTRVPRAWHEAYIELQANPLVAKTDKAFCEEIQLDISTFEKWKGKYRTQIFAEVEKRRKLFRNEVRSLLWKSLAKKMASGRGVDAEKLIAQLIGDLVERTETKVEHYDDESKKRRINTLLSEIGNRQEAWERAETAEVRPGNPSSGLESPELGRTDPPATPESPK